MDVRSTLFKEVVILIPEVFHDERGFLMEVYQERRYKDLGIGPFVQENHSRSVAGTLRGLHYQIQMAQGKLVRVLQGRIFDVAVDLRKDSPTFGQWAGEILSADGREQMWIPPCFAHGFYVISDGAEVEYKLTDYYAPEWQRTVRWDDPDIGIAWPLVEGRPLFLSRRDQKGTALKDAEVYTLMGTDNRQAQEE